MKAAALSTLWLRAQLALRRVNPVIAGAVLLLAAAFAALAWVAMQRVGFDAQFAAARRQAAMPAPPPAAAVAAPPTADQNLAHFYNALGDRSKVDRQLKTLFALAEKNGLVLRQGEYRSSYDRGAKLTTYQLNLPVTGRYGAIWQFAFDALRAVPHASLDDVSFRRDAIGLDTVDARLRMTLYLSATPGVPR
ncbi:hypothetical protein [Massilia yuzhufengensis]|uniref:Transmembrane protein n=1 Tax=Massilia yuzhufengensis TaxID=1164594 RepID=A0A1I1PHM1_9BURK|nr:hypothetical protein [Massilia yuzhufengensis]SFD07188.1 hypothetical protein SAMN05216204_11584 [Massilia yuzhufengensis]